MSNARNLARLLPSSTGQLPDAAMSSGSVLQVVQGTAQGSTAVSSSSYAATNLTVSITPTSATSKILVFGQIFVNGSTNRSQPTINVVRNGSTYVVSQAYGFGDFYTDAGGYTETILPFSIIDSPASTSPQTYTIYGKNASAIGSAYFGDNVRIAVITAMEIAA